MARKFDAAYAAEKIKAITAATWRAVIGDIDARIGDLETLRPDLEASIESLTGVALARINDVLTPQIAKIQAFASKGFLLAKATSTHTLHVGDNHSLTVPPGEERDLFTPPPFCTLSRLSNYTDYAVVRTLFFDRATGLYACTVLACYGNPGPFSDWVIAADAGVSQAIQGVLADTMAARDLARDWATKPAGEVVAGQGFSARKYAADTASDVLVTGMNKAAAAAAAATATTKAGEASAAADRAATFDPSNYPTKAVVNGQIAALKGTASATYDTLGKLEVGVSTNATAIAEVARARTDHDFFARFFGG